MRQKLVLLARLFLVAVFLLTLTPTATAQSVSGAWKVQGHPYIQYIGGVSSTACVGCQQVIVGISVTTLDPTISPSRTVPIAGIFVELSSFLQDHGGAFELLATPISGDCIDGYWSIIPGESVAEFFGTIYCPTTNADFRLVYQPINRFYLTWEEREIFTQGGSPTTASVSEYYYMQVTRSMLYTTYLPSLRN